MVEKSDEGTQIKLLTPMESMLEHEHEEGEL
jgi:hypothetical protein